jgi:hypothetical protein
MVASHMVNVRRSMKTISRTLPSAATEVIMTSTAQD